MTRVKIGFTAPGSITLNVDDPEDTDAIIESFVEKINQMDEDELAEHVESDGGWLAENIIYIANKETGHMLKEW